MAPSVKFAIAILAMLLVASIANGDPTCSPAGRQYCNRGRCCSKFNWCGSGAAYCGRGNCIWGPCWKSAEGESDELRVTAARNFTAIPTVAAAAATTQEEELP